MPNPSATRYTFIAHALDGDGPFRPSVSYDGLGKAALAGQSYLVRYPRESDEKYARRCELAFFASPLAQACSRFTGYIGTRPVIRTYPHELYAAMADDIDGKGNDIGVFFGEFEKQAKARGAMCLLVDMPATMAPNLAEQMEARVAPYWTAIKPESITDYAIGDHGKFEFAEFAGNYQRPDGSRVECIWHFDEQGWKALDKENKVIDADLHGLTECPILIFTEGGDFPHFGPFSAIADLSKRLFNLDSEMDEILRSQTFSLLTMQVPENSTEAQKLAAAQTVGQTIGTSNLMVHSGSTPAFIAPDSGPADTYLKRIDKIREQIGEIGLNVATINQQESGVAMQMRFASINAELSSFSGRMEDLERRAWELSRQWLGMTQAPDTQWPRDFNLADVESELRILTEMQGAAMPDAVIAEQSKRITSIQFSGLDQERQDAISAAIDERLLQTN